jgi:hypothetical protein
MKVSGAWCALLNRASRKTTALHSMHGKEATKPVKTVNLFATANGREKQQGLIGLM